MLACELWNLPENLERFSSVLRGNLAPWEWVALINKCFSLLELKPLTSDNLPVLSGMGWIHPSVKISPLATIQGPVYIGAGTEIRPGAFLRGNVIIGENCVIGNSCEIKNSILLNHVQVPHFNYVGDSVLGNHSHLGAGAILANLRLDQKNIVVKLGEEKFPTKQRKLGALLGDGAQVGCNAVLQPGTVLGCDAVVFSGVAFGGYAPAGSQVRPSARPIIVEGKAL